MVDVLRGGCVTEALTDLRKLVGEIGQRAVQSGALDRARVRCSHTMAQPLQHALELGRALLQALTLQVRADRLRGPVAPSVRAHGDPPCPWRRWASSAVAQAYSHSASRASAPRAARSTSASTVSWSAPS